jgi:hypothetical protein
MSLRRPIATAGLAAAALVALQAAPVLAQAAAGMPESYRQVQLSALQLQRRTLLAMADSMPETLYRDKVTPVQRDFAQQIHHAAVPFQMFLTRFMNAPAATGLPDTAAIFNTRAGLRAYVNGVYDYAEGVLRNQTAADREASVPFFGMQKPRWQIWDELHQHTFWTAGQVVANFRKHNMAPPPFGFF